MDTDSHIIKDNTGSIINYPKQITIGDNVWIGCRCLILKGAQIPDNCVIGADSIVNRLLENRNSLYAGSPVKLMKENITWEM
jgi:acetyltransferase-like isoleucine patch superfamily enzyme